MKPTANGILVGCSNATVGYKNFHMENVSFSIGRRDFLQVCGPNGSGKTTLLKSIGGILPLLHGRWDRAEDLSIGYVPQQTALDTIFPFSTEEVIAQGLLNSKKSFDHEDSVLKMATKVDLMSELKTPFRLLSGGQRQRALIARALIRTPGLLILDEPTSGLDKSATNRLLTFLTDLYNSSDVAVAMVTHHEEELNDVATHVVNLDFGINHFEMNPRIDH